MKRYACHRLYITPDYFIRMPIITLDKQGRVVAYTRFQEESNSTEWIGGIVFLSPETSILPGKNLNELLQTYMKPSEPHDSLYAWHISNIDFEKGCFTSQSILQRLTPETIISL